MAAESRYVEVSREEPIAVLALNRPEVLNALNFEVMRELADRLEELDADPAIGCAVLTGKGRAFAAGADIGEMAGLGVVDLIDRQPFSVWQRIDRIRMPIVAAVNGYALGGGLELAMSCDIILAAASARLGQPEIQLGIIPGAGGTQRLPRRIGRYRASEWILTGARYTAEEALAAGLVNRVVPDEQLLEAARELARSIAARPRQAVRAAKEALRASERLPLDEGLRLERHLFEELFATQDKQEGMRAFLEKREPRFTGR
ncbi:MAG: enoyl-CoA hydratase/isomerase family protein [Firmicutes bacterium]|nr:enoyl-CoA hydratase/isomerase family protein [Bacillota bacterium]